MKSNVKGKTLIDMNPYQFAIFATQQIANDPEIDSSEREGYNRFSLKLNSDKITLVNINEKLVPLIQATDNEIFFRQMFLNRLFINVNFRFGKYIIKGIFADKLNPDDKSPHLDKIAKDEGNKSNYKENNMVLIFYALDTISLDTLSLIGFLINDVFSYENDKTARVLKEEVKKYVCNILDFVNNSAEDDIKIVTIETSKERNEKRKKRGKLPQPTIIHIKPRSKFLNYINEFNKNSKKKAFHKYQVRGHSRHFKSERYSEKRRRKPKWIKPHYKGKGILIKKSYQLDGESK